MWEIPAAYRVPGSNATCLLAVEAKHETTRISGLGLARYTSGADAKNCFWSPVPDGRQVKGIELVFGTFSPAAQLPLLVRPVIHRALDFHAGIVRMSGVCSSFTSRHLLRALLESATGAAAAAAWSI